MNEREATIQLACEATSLQGMLQEGGKAGEYAGKRVAAIDMAIAALKEAEQYRQLGTVEELRAALEKQIAEQAHFDDDFECPNCGYSTRDINIITVNYCPDCGQRLKWEE